MKKIVLAAAMAAFAGPAMANSLVNDLIGKLDGAYDAYGQTLDHTGSRTGSNAAVSAQIADLLYTIDNLNLEQRQATTATLYADADGILQSNADNLPVVTVKVGTTLAMVLEDVQDLVNTVNNDFFTGINVVKDESTFETFNDAVYHGQTEVAYDDRGFAAKSLHDITSALMAYNAAVATLEAASLADLQNNAGAEQARIEALRVELERVWNSESPKYNDAIRAFNAVAALADGTTEINGETVSGAQHYKTYDIRADSVAGNLAPVDRNVASFVIDGITYGDDANNAYDHYVDVAAAASRVN